MQPPQKTLRLRVEAPRGSCPRVRFRPEEIRRYDFLDCEIVFSSFRSQDEDLLREPLGQAGHLAARLRLCEPNRRRAVCPREPRITAADIDAKKQKPVTVRAAIS